MAEKSKKRYNPAAGMPLHDARRLLGLPIIAHTGRVNHYARCMGGKLRKVFSLTEAQNVLKALDNRIACGGTPGGQKASWVRKDGTRVYAK